MPAILAAAAHAARHRRVCISCGAGRASATGKAQP